MAVRLIAPLLFGGSFLFATLSSTPAPAAPTVVACDNPTKIKAIVSAETTNSATHLQTFQNLPEAAVNFTQGGTGPSCVVVRFSAEAGASLSPNVLVVRALLDGVKVAEPAEVHFGVSEDSQVARSFDFIFPSVAPGSHVLRMQYKSWLGGSVFVSSRNTIVLFQ